MSAIGSLSSSNMQYLLQQSNQVAQQVKQNVKSQVASAQDGFAAALNGATGTSSTNGIDQLSGLSMASLLQGSSANASANTASQTASSLLNMLV